MDIKLKHRLVGACVILALAVFFLPMILDSEKYRSDIESEIPQQSALQSEDNENSQALAEESGTLTINLEEDEPQKAIEEPTADNNDNTVEKPEEQNQDSDGEQYNSSEEQAVIDDKTDSAIPEQEVEEEESKPAGSQISSEDSSTGNDEKVTDKPSVEAPKTPETTAQTKDSASPDFKEQAWVIQIGSFSNKDNATGLVAKLRTQGYRAYQRQSGEFSRVFVGPYPDQEAAQKRQPGLEKIIGTPVKLIEFDAGEH